MDMNEIYTRKVEGRYPYCLLRAIFSCNGNIVESEENQSLFEDTLQKVIELRCLTQGETEVLFKMFRDGKSIAEIAAEKGEDPEAVRLQEAAALRKLRHPTSSKQLKDFLVIEEYR